MLALFQRLANARALAVLTVFYILFPAVILPAAEAQIKAYSGGVGPIDLKFTYTPAEVFQMVEAYGEQGRAFYRTVELTGDILYPIAYTLFFGTLLTAVLRRAFPQNTMVQRLPLLAVLGFLFDMAENVGIVTMLSQFPTQSETVAQLTSIFTTLKWVTFGAMILTLLTGLIVWLVRRFTGQSKSVISG
jgi:hypothetical protein